MTLFLSDTHLGNARSKADDLCRFLYHHGYDDTLYLVGDILDDITMRRWPQAHRDAISMMLRFERVIYLPGNHDSSFRAVLGLNSDHVAVMDEAVYFSEAGKKYLVKHGDSYDQSLGFIIGPGWFRDTGAAWLNRWHSKHSNHWVQHGSVEEATTRGFDGIICGHTHTPANKFIGKIHFLNCGDWLGNCTAVVDRGADMKLIRSE